MVHVIVVPGHVLNDLDLGRRIPHVELVHLVVCAHPCSSRARTVDIFSRLALDPHCVGYVAEAACRHLAGLPRRVLLLGGVSSRLQVGERGASGRRVERSSFVLTFISPPTYLLGFGL